jgi:hypothetical protein
VCLHAGGQLLRAAVARKLFSKRFIRGKNWGLEGNFLICRGKISMEHMQNCKKWFELKTRLGKNCTIDEFN